MPLPILSVLIAGIACVVASAVCLALIGHDRGIRWSDLPFLFFLALALVYLEISPSLALVGKSLPLIEQRASHYIRLQIALFIAFVLPLVGGYGWRRPRAPADEWPRETTRLTSMVWDVLLVMVALVRLAIAWRYDFWRLRVGDAVVEKTGAAPFVIYSLFRLVVEAQLPLVTVAALRIGRMRTFIARAAFGFFLLVQLGFALLNSRFSILYLFIAAVFGLAIARRPAIRIDRRVRRIAILSLISVYGLGLAVLQLRASTADRSVAIGSVSLNVLADQQGVNRFNCVDLLAQIAPFQGNGVAGPGIWEGQLWNFKRFVDPAGFAAFRESLVTSGKSHLILKYLGQRQSDYYSCMLTDGFGALGLWGAVGLGLVCGLLLRTARALTESSGLAWMFAGVWLAWQVLVFEQEAGSLLFSWPLRVPILIGLLITAHHMTVRAASSTRRARSRDLHRSAPGIGQPS